MTKTDARITGRNIGRALANEAIRRNWTENGFEFPLNRGERELRDAGRWYDVALAEAKKSWLERLLESEGEVEARKHEALETYR